MNQEIRFNDEVVLARFIAQLLREGVAFKVETKGYVYIVVLTGGY